MQKYQGKIAFISIVGDAKSGKTFLMNNLIGLEQSKFEPESSRLQKPTAVTYLWSTPLYLPQEDKYIFFIDTQGMEKGEQYDNSVGQKIFAIITLISSCLLYNIMGDLTESSLKKLYMIATLPGSVTKNALNQDNENNEEKISQFFPKLMLLIRDVEKDSKDKKIVKTSPKENMESLIHDFSRTKNELTIKIKKTMVSLFKERDCLSFPKPNKGSYQQLNYNQEQINQDFLNGLISLREKIEKDVQEKVIFNTFLNSRMVCSLLQSFVDIGNQNGVFDLNTS